MSSLPTTRAAHALHHEENFQAAVKAIDKAVSRALGSSEKYDRVGVLSLRWENDDLGLASIERELLDVFKDKFLFETDALIIPATSARAASLAVREKLQAFVDKYDSPTSLLIVIYQGHAAAQMFTAGQPLQIFGSLAPRSVSLPWTFLEGYLIADGDVLIIMDTCCATAAAMGQGDIEYLVASAFESSATDIIQRSFSRRLIDLLNDSSCNEITVAQIHAKLVTMANQPATQLDYTPVHVATKERPSITLCRLDRSTREAIDIRKTDELADGKVLIHVSLRGKTSTPDVEQWKTWLSSAIPEAVADVRVEAAFNSNSSLCLITVPIAVWDMLKGDEAYKFVAFVESNNLLCPGSDSEHAGIPERPAGDVHPGKGKNGNVQ